MKLFFRHLNLILPNKQDQIILISYLAACVQYKDKKFQWVPLLQGAEGNGKSYFSRCLKNLYISEPKMKNKIIFETFPIDKTYVYFMILYGYSDYEGIYTFLEYFNIPNKYNPVLNYLPLG